MTKADDPVSLAATQDLYGAFLTISRDATVHIAIAAAIEAPLHVPYTVRLLRIDHEPIICAACESLGDNGALHAEQHGPRERATTCDAHVSGQEPSLVGR
jgi:hypothetical protein